MKKFYVLLVVFLIIISGTAFANTYTVTNTNPSGDGSISWAIGQANSNSGTDTIVFSVSGTITVPRYGPDITYVTDDGTIIDASSQWIGVWPAGSPGIIIKGHDLNDPASSPYYGIKIDGANNCEIKGIHFQNLGYGIMVSGGDYNTIGGTGTSMRNVFSGNNYGIEIRNYAHYNTICGNYIGTDVNGTLDEGNLQAGVQIGFYSDNNTVGGTTEAARNIISGNNNYGVWISGSNTDANTVIGNYIGTQVNGTTALANGSGVYLSTSTKNNTIGGTSAGARNIISGNTYYGVKIQHTGTNNNTVWGNYIGTDKNGTADLGNTSVGVYIIGGAQNNTVGGTSAASRNIISGNDHSGVCRALPEKSGGSHCGHRNC